jgi:glutamate receptor ionotropic, NMDA 1
MRLKINDSDILWPGKVRKKPEGIMIPTHLKVLTIEEKPFVYVRRMTDDEIECEDDEIPCPHFNSTSGAGNTVTNNQYIYWLLVYIVSINIIEEAINPLFGYA